MKKLRKNIDLPLETIAILQVEATLQGHGSLKPFIEKVLVDFATECAKSSPVSVKKVRTSKKDKS